jgi:hypothetical protein
MKSTAHTILLQSQALGSQTQHWLPMVTMSMYKLWSTATLFSLTFGTYTQCYFLRVLLCTNNTFAILLKKLLEWVVVVEMVWKCCGIRIIKCVYRKTIQHSQPNVLVLTFPVHKNQFENMNFKTECTFYRVSLRLCVYSRPAYVPAHQHSSFSK